MRILFLFFVLFISCNKDSSAPSDINFDGKDHLEEIDSVSGGKCLVLRKNILYDSAEGLKFKLKIVHVLDEDWLYSNFPIEFESPDLLAMDTFIVKSVNKIFNPYKIGFGIHKHEEYYNGSVFDDIVKDYEHYQEYGVITLVVYHTKIGENYGATINNPSNIFAVHADKIKTKTVAHELGHVFGLLHVHDPDPTKGDTPDYGDGICDTPSINIMDFDLDIHCKYSGEKEFTEDELKILIPNYMLYENDHCRHNFSPVQVYTMRWFIQKTPILYSALY